MKNKNRKNRFNNGEETQGNYEAYILIRSPQLLFHKMKSRKEDKNMTTDTITISYNCNVKWKDTIRKKSRRKVNT